MFYFKLVRYTLRIVESHDRQSPEERQHIEEEKCISMQNFKAVNM